MGQITKAFAEQMLEHCKRGEHPPITVWEAEQLARAWLEREELRSSAPRAPEGYVIVPREPTKAMIQAAFDLCEIDITTTPYSTGNEFRRAIYDAMIRAAADRLGKEGT